MLWVRWDSNSGSFNHESRLLLINGRTEGLSSWCPPAPLFFQDNFSRQMKQLTNVITTNSKQTNSGSGNNLYCPFHVLVNFERNYILKEKHVLWWKYCLKCYFDILSSRIFQNNVSYFIYRDTKLECAIGTPIRGEAKVFVVNNMFNNCENVYWVKRVQEQSNKKNMS